MMLIKFDEHIFAVLLIIFLEVNTLLAYRNGAIPDSACATMTPQHDGASSQPATSNPYSIIVSFRTYLPGRKLQVHLNATSATTFRGFYVQSRSLVNEQPVGVFDGSDLARRHTCISTIPINSQRNTISHSNKWRNNPSSILSVDWMVNPDFSDDIYFRGTFVQSFNTFWTNVQSPYLRSLELLNLTECCLRESGMTTAVNEFCLSLSSATRENSNLVFESFINIFFENYSNRHGLFRVLRCFHWSTSSSQLKRSTLSDCCLARNASSYCQARFCEPENFTTHAEYDAFFQYDGECTSDMETIAECYFPSDCSSSTLNCDSNAVCTNIVGGSTCTCFAGFTGDGFNCQDIDECTSNPCSLNANCINTIGTFNCTCRNGFSGSGFSCLDIDDCFDNTLNDCHMIATCTNVAGGFLCSCPAGYTGDGNSCQDINECLSNPCISNAFCENFPGTFYCICNDGFTGNGITCQDINECSASILNNCYMTATCTNMAGGFYCTCPAGFSGDGTSCQGFTSSSTIATTSLFITPSTAQPIPLNAVRYTIVTTILFNTISTIEAINAVDSEILITSLSPLAGYNLISLVNYTTNTTAIVATHQLEYLANNLNGFWRFPTLTQVQNVIDNRAASLNYWIANGTVFLSNIIYVNHAVTNMACASVFCATPPPRYNTLCISIGSSSQKCMCVSNNIERHCEDIADCSSSTLNCDSNAVCTNIIGGSTCTCFAGFTGDGFNCKDIDECTSNPCSPNANCINTIGTFNCTCRNGFTGSGFSCLDIDECFDNTLNDCHMIATCTNVAGGFLCSCPADYTGDGTSCQVLPSTTLPENHVIYNVETRLLVNPTSNNQKRNFINRLLTELLVPALSPLTGYQSMKVVSDRVGSLIVTSQVIFMATNTNDRFVFPTLSDMQNGLDTRANLLNNTLSGSVLFDPIINVSQRATNGLCNPSPCSPVFNSYNVTCVEIGINAFSCLCIANGSTGVDCNSLQMPTTTTSSPQESSGFGIGEIIGIVVGAIVLIVMVMAIIYCLKKRKSPPIKRASDPYIIPATMKTSSFVEGNSEPIYVEIEATRKRSLPQVNGYVDFSGIQFNLPTEKNKIDVKMDTTNTYESPVMSEEENNKPPLPDNHPNPENCFNNHTSGESSNDAKVPIVMQETDDGYMEPMMHANKKDDKETIHSNILPSAVDGGYDHLSHKSHLSPKRCSTDVGSGYAETEYSKIEEPQFAFHQDVTENTRQEDTTALKAEVSEDIATEGLTTPVVPSFDELATL